MLEIKSDIEYCKIVFHLPNVGEIDENVARNQADAHLQKKHDDIFMGGYAFEQAYYDKYDTYVVEYSR